MAGRVEAIAAFRENDSFRTLILAFKRIVNILEGRTEGGENPDPKLFAEPAEKELFEAFGKAKSAADAALAARKYPEALGVDRRAGGAARPLLRRRDGPLRGLGASGEPGLAAPGALAWLRPVRALLGGGGGAEVGGKGDHSSRVIPAFASARRRFSIRFSAAPAAR